MGSPSEPIWKVPPELAKGGVPVWNCGSVMVPCSSQIRGYVLPASSPVVGVTVRPVMVSGYSATSFVVISPVAATTSPVVKTVAAAMSSAMMPAWVRVSNAASNSVAAALPSAPGGALPCARSASVGATASRFPFASRCSRRIAKAYLRFGLRTKPGWAATATTLGRLSVYGSAGRVSATVG